MEKTKKYAEVAVLKETFASATSAVVIEFKGLVVGKDTAFRKSIRESKAQYRVSKNTLLRLAVKDTSFESLGGSFQGASAIATTDTDVVAMAKAVNGFLKDNPAANFKAGIMDGKPMSAQQLQTLAELPSRDVLLSKLLYLMKYPISGMAVVLEGIRKQKAGE